LNFPNPSITGYRYYVIFVDDFSRYIWFYPFHAKSDVFSIFVKFKTLAENQFSFHIRKRQYDRGGEYASLQFQSFLSQHGKLYRKTCPHTSQHNGVAERKLRHILETSPTMLPHSSLSNRYWVDSFFTVVYIINRLPTVVLNQLSPFEKIFDKAPDYALLKVFG
jgi:transposase InsO family protein